MKTISFMPVTHITIQPAEAGQKIVQLLRHHVGKDVPKSAFMRVIRKGQVRVDGRRVKPFDRVVEGQDVRIPPFRTTQTFLTLSPKAFSLSVISEDADMLVINKTAGLPVHPGTGCTDAVTTRLHSMFPDAPFAPVPVHRLDKNTSGILLVAKSFGFLHSMQNLWKAGKVHKVYLARVHGRWKSPGVTRLTDALVKSGLPGREQMHTGSGKHSLCDVAPVTVGSAFSLLAVRLLTGRTHQIRVQLASRGFPLIGDPKYGGPIHRTMLLHAWTLSWKDRHICVLPPWTGDFGVGEDLPSADHFFPGELHR